MRTAYLFLYLPFWGIGCALILFGCGAGSSSAIHSTPSPTTNELYSGITASADDVYAGYSIDTDSPIISSYEGQIALQSFLAKQPSIDAFNRLSAPTNYVNGAWIKGDSHYLSDVDTGLAQSGKYFLWGALSEQPHFATILTYDLQASWQCTGCSISSGVSEGRFTFYSADKQGQFKLHHPVFTMSATLSLQDKNQLSYPLNNPLKVQIDGKTFTSQTIAIKGAFFGPNAENVGWVFGLQNPQSQITGIALGHQP